MPPLITSCVSLAATALALAGLGVWYVFELTYIEKKANKQKRRSRRTKHSIPWNKIRIGGAAVAASQAVASSQAATEGQAAAEGKAAADEPAAAAAT